ncbi:hypothetical protein [Pseudobacteroides cellulosolvens]|uniref:Uncharacterized protein n=1 Tax=Pseudobacteroides cellulosolvens ATCC 35603 = DSM 2933 TaxID=398512 RepID=A0A0L6JI16_9FIRM|nr:hypothetical protein [Pseudobacteroides cellulosolvens]KNY25338.1 hypothetical protein Bccel_0598 [Pseudobacteroides cellulosolvens ATCC 35603 = DSM 2933]
MYTQVEKPKENKGRVVANSVTQKKSVGKQGFGFVDNRSETVSQGKLKRMARNSLQDKQITQLQAIRVLQMAGRNVLYRGPEIMVKMYRGSDYPWELRAMQTGRIMSKGLREFKLKAPLEMAKHTMDANSGEFAPLPPREIRNRHAISSSHGTGGETHTPASNYASLVNDPARAIEWGTRIFRFDVWRSDLWQGGVDYDRGGPEGEWLIEGDTKIYNVETSTDKGTTWVPVNQVLDHETSTLYERLQHVR